MLLVHEMSVAHGLNMQSGGNNIIWYNNTWSLEGKDQLIARLRRRRQLKGRVFNHQLIMVDTIDEPITQAVNRKDATQESVLKYLKDWRTER